MNYYNYFTEIEEHFISRRGKHLFVAPLDWHLIASWRVSGIPLNVALRGIDIAMDTWQAKRSRIGDRVSTLAYCHDSVMQEYARHLDTQVGEESTAVTENAGLTTAETTAEKHDIIHLVQKRISEIKTARGKQLPVETAEGMDRALQRLTEIGQMLEALGEEPDFEATERDLGVLDGMLVEALRAAIPAEQSGKWEQEGKQDLKVYKKRLPKDVFEKIRADYMRGKIRQFFQIGELSLFNR
jgi:hypothetical protein